MSRSDRFVRPSSSRKIRSSAVLRASSSADRLRVTGTDPEQDDEARPDLADHLPVDANSGTGRALEERSHGWLGGGMTPCSATKASRHASASRSYPARAASWRSRTSGSVDAGTSRS